MLKVLITGGAGFIGSALVRKLVLKEGARVLNIDKLTYAGHESSLTAVRDNPNYSLLKADINDGRAVNEALDSLKPDFVFHLAAESHVDRSIDGPSDFIQTNIVGTYSMLEAVRSYWNGLESSVKSNFRFVHISTDEVFGSIESGKFSESSQYQPSSPYSASKASSDHLVRAWHHTFHIPTLISNCTNNYGPYQFPEKLIPLVIRKAIRGEKLPVYGTGKNVRDWLFVGDHVDALWSMALKGRPGETYCIGGECEKENIEVVRSICRIVDDLKPTKEPREQLITFVADRPGHDGRYAMDISKMRKETGWSPAHNFDNGLKETVLWYLNNEEWCNTVSDSKYRGERIGLGKRT